MKDIPIIFSAPMIKALLEGRKTMKRRTLNRLRITATPESSSYTLTGDDAERALLEAADFRNIDSNLWVWSAKAFDHQAPATRTHWHARIPYAVGDRLWVRESLRRFDREPPTAQYIADITGVPAPVCVDRHPNGAALWQWKQKAIPSIHMPRWASRLTLVVTGVKVERVQDINDADAIAEGVGAWRAGWSQKEAGLAFLRGTEAAVETKDGTVAQRLFYLLWTSLHGGDAWAENPFVVAITFRVIKANIDTQEARAA